MYSDTLAGTAVWEKRFMMLVGVLGLGLDLLRLGAIVWGCQGGNVEGAQTLLTGAG